LSGHKALRAASAYKPRQFPDDLNPHTILSLIFRG
jgi:hypothetical protein